MVPTRDSNGVGAMDRALNRIVAEIYSGLRHGYFVSVTCEVIDRRRRQLVLMLARIISLLRSMRRIAIGPLGRATSRAEALMMSNDIDAPHPGYREPAMGPVRVGARVRTLPSRW